MGGRNEGWLMGGLGRMKGQTREAHAVRIAGPACGDPHPQRRFAFDIRQPRQTVPPDFAAPLVPFPDFHSPTGGSYLARYMVTRPNLVWRVDFIEECLFVTIRRGVEEGMQNSDVPCRSVKSGPRARNAPHWKRPRTRPRRVPFSAKPSFHCHAHAPVPRGPFTSTSGLVS